MPGQKISENPSFPPCLLVSFKGSTPQKNNQHTGQNKSDGWDFVLTTKRHNAKRLVPIAHPIHQKTKTFGENDSLRDALLVRWRGRGALFGDGTPKVGHWGDSWCCLKNNWNIHDQGQKLIWYTYSTKKQKGAACKVPWWIKTWELRHFQRLLLLVLWGG